MPVAPRFAGPLDGVVTITGLASEVTISNFEATDRLVINGLAGDDVITATGLGTAMQLTENGGDGADVLIGSPGNDVLLGGAGNDILIGGGGLDVLDGGTGSNILVGSSMFAAGLGLLAPAAASTFFTGGTSIAAPSLAEQPTLSVPHS